MIQRLRPTVVTDPYSGLPTGEDWTTPAATDLPGYLFAWASSVESPTVNRDQLSNQAVLVRPGGVAVIEVLSGDRISAKGLVWEVASHPMSSEYADLLGVGLIAGSAAGTTWNLRVWEG